MLLFAGVLSLGLVILGTIAAAAHVMHRHVPWGLVPFRALVAATAVVWASMVVWLWELPAFAARQGAGTGAAWPAQSAAVVSAVLLGAFLYLGAWQLARRAPVAAGAAPALVAVVMLLARHLSTYGAPAEFYVADDGKLWIAYGVVSVAAAVGLVLYGTHAPRTSERRGAYRVVAPDERGKASMRTPGERG